jgi:hypothetical protein
LLRTRGQRSDLEAEGERARRGRCKMQILDRLKLVSKVVLIFDYIGAHGSKIHERCSSDFLPKFLMGACVFWTKSPEGHSNILCLIAF